MAKIIVKNQETAIAIATSLIESAFEFTFMPRNYSIIKTLANKRTVTDYLIRKGFSESDFEFE
ncbi:hypothetical protein L0N18_23755 [Phocaeicola dorei]|uniref:hypothetical protein n=1 Tax=Phocaeicola dorei TaxID=357276 RepID=UPI001D06FA9F|nr:hypothetical protein [Phocaeicola dorei]MCB6967207.1 hypothetical protein [Phocaeicola dorei]MCG4616627.1 hypothetical protein [Phocaeicola dorei]MCG4639773.1 hypothetical protein [Phocaeicola dorei]